MLSNRPLTAVMAPDERTVLLYVQSLQLIQSQDAGEYRRKSLAARTAVSPLRDSARLAEEHFRECKKRQAIGEMELSVTIGVLRADRAANLSL